MKTFPSVFAILLLLLCVSPSVAFSQTAAPDEQWVSIRYQDKGVNLPATECYGLIHKADLAAMLGSTGKIAGFIKVTRVAVMENGQIFQQSDANANGIRLGFRNVLYIRADTILRVIELDDTFVTQRLLPLKEQPR